MHGEKGRPSRLSPLKSLARKAVRDHRPQIKPGMVAHPRPSAVCERLLRLLHLRLFVQFHSVAGVQVFQGKHYHPG